MARYVAFLRGVMPTNAKMPELRRCFAAAGFANVATVLASGNVLFDARAAVPATLERRIEAAMQQHLGRSFLPIVRRLAELEALLAADRHASFRLPADAKRIVTFLRQPPTDAPRLPLRREGLHVLAIAGSDVFGAYQPNPRGPIFMKLLQQFFGSEQTTRTCDTIRRCIRG